MTAYLVLEALALFLLSFLLLRRALFQAGHEGPGRLRKGLALVLAGLGLFLLAGPAMMGLRLASTGSGVDRPVWFDSLEAGKAAAARTGKVLMVDAWADWCTSCKRLKSETFEDAEVQRRLNGLVLVELDMDQPRNDGYYAEFGIKGLPWVAFFTPDGQLLAPLLLTDFEPAGDFLGRLDRAAAADQEELAYEEEEGLSKWLESKGFWVTLLLVFLAGIAASVTPCTYPAYFLIFAFLSSGSDQASKRRRGLVSALLVVAGMVLTYVSLGIAAGLGGSAVGSALANPFVMGAIAVLLFVLGLSSAGVVSFSDLTSFRTFIGKRQKSTYLWALIFGAVMGIIVAPCVGPLLIAILMLIAGGQDVLRGGLLMLSFGLGMGLLFLLLGVSSGYVRSFVRPGRFSTLVGLVFGVVFVAAALYYLKGVLAYEELFRVISLQ